MFMKGFVAVGCSMSLPLVHPCPLDSASPGGMYSRIALALLHCCQKGKSDFLRSVIKSIEDREDIPEVQ